MGTVTVGTTPVELDDGSHATINIGNTGAPGSPTAVVTIGSRTERFDAGFSRRLTTGGVAVSAVTAFGTTTLAVDTTGVSPTPGLIDDEELAEAIANLALGDAALLDVGTGAGTVAAGNDARIVGAAQKSANLSDLGSAATSRTNLGAETAGAAAAVAATLGTSATRNVGTSTGQVAAGDDSRIVGAAQKAANLSDLANAGTARTNLGLSAAATASTGTTTGTLAAGDDSRIVGAAQKSANLSDVADAAASRTNIGAAGASDMTSALAAKAPTASPTFTGAVVVPAASGDTSPMQLGQAAQYPNSSGRATIAARVPHYDVRDYGAVGDGTTDDTAAIQAALTAAGAGAAYFRAGGTVYFPPGIYGISSVLAMPSSITLRGPGADVLYPNFSTDWQTTTPTWGTRTATIQYRTGHGAIFDGGSKCSFEGLVFRYPGSRNSSDVVFSANPNHFRFVNNVVQNMYACRYDLAGGWGAGYIANNQFIGCNYSFAGSFLDSKIIGNTFTSMSGGNAIYLSTGAGPNLIMGNRFEFNETPAIQFYTGSRNNVVIGNVFDSHATHAIAVIQNTDQNVIANNLFWRNGRTMPGDYTDAHIYMQASSGQVIEGNEFKHGFPDGGSAWNGPKYVIGVDSMSAHKNRFKNNNTRQGCSSSAVVVDRYGTSAGCLEADSIDVPAGATPGTGTDDLSAALGVLSRILAAPTPVFIYENRTVVGYNSIPNVILTGAQGTPALSNSSGALNLIGGAHNISYGGLTYNTVGGNVTASAVPNGFGNNGGWTVGFPIYTSAPVIGGSLGWIKTTVGSPDTWVTFGTVQSYTGTATLVGGTVTVSNSAVAAGTSIRLSTRTPGGTPGALFVSAKVNGTSFTITSTSASDTSVVYWEIIN